MLLREPGPKLLGRDSRAAHFRNRSPRPAELVFYFKFIYEFFDLRWRQRSAVEIVFCLADDGSGRYDALFKFCLQSHIAELSGRVRLFSRRTFPNDHGHPTRRRVTWREGLRFLDD